MKKQNRKFLVITLGPALLIFVVMFVYPIIRTVIISLYKLPAVSAKLSQGEFIGLKNYVEIFNSPTFIASLKNIAVIWSVGGVLTLGIAMLLAAILASGVKWKRFWRSAIYLPNIVNAVALSSMWLQYVYQNKFGLLKKLFGFLGLESLARINWTDPRHLFWAMLISYVYGSIGYYMLIFLSGIEGIPQDLYDCAYLDGANAWQRLTKITIPLLRNVVRTCFTLWTISAVNFFTWSKMFSSNTNIKTITPVVYMYERTFGTSMAVTELNVGVGAAVGVVVSIIVLVVHFIMNKVLREEDLEY